jgi:hypothetical protein
MPECFGPASNWIRRVGVLALHEDKRRVKRSGKPLSIWEWSRDPFGFR